MWFLVTISLLVYSSFSIFGGAEHYVANIQINLKKNDKDIVICEPVVPIPKMTLGKQFSVSVKSEEIIHHGSCLSDYFGSKSILNFTHYEGYYKLTTRATVKNNIKNVLNCTFSVNCDPDSIYCKNRNGQYNAEIRCDVPVDIRIPSIGFMTLNGNKVLTHAAAEDADYDFFKFLDFVDGQQARFACKKNTDDAAITQLKLKNGINDIIEWKEESFKHNIEMYVKLTKDYENGYVDCVIKHFSRNKRVIIRTFFTLQKISSEYSFRVNDMMLTPISYQNNTIQTLYEYFDGEVLKVQSVKNTEDYENNMMCRQQNIPVTVLQNWNLTSKIDFSMNTKEVSHNVSGEISSVDCSIKRIQNSERGIYLDISLKLIPNSFNYSPAIRGLSMAKVLLKINGTEVNTIHYDYEDDEELYLRCFSNTSGLQWDYSTADVTADISNTTHFNSNINNYYKSGKFKLNANSRSTVISCKQPFDLSKGLKKITKVVLLRKKNSNDRHTDETEYTKNEGEAEYTTEPNNKVPTEASSIFQNKNTWLIGGLVVLFLILISSLIFIGFTKKRKQPVKNVGPDEINYENLPEHNTGPMTLPSQWNEAQYATPSDIQQSEYAEPYQSHIYAKPLPKHLRQGAPDASYEDPAYAEVGSFGPTYSQVVPKSARAAQNGVQVLPNINESMYAEIMLRESQTKPAPVESPYAEVIRKNDGKTISDAPASKYANVFDNKRYVNTNTSANDDYAEPAYCEINALK